MSPEVLFFTAFIVFIGLLLALDLGVFHKKDHEIGIREAAVWTGIWILLALGLGLFIRLKGEWIHGKTFETTAELIAYRKELFSQYLAGYFLEKSLSIDNIFVMIMIFVSFGINKAYYHRVLFWGILGAIVMRFVFIFTLGALIEKFSWILAVFGVILIYSGIKMFVKKDDDSMDTSKHPVVRFASKYCRCTSQLDGHNFFTKIDGKRYMTPLFLVLLVIEFSDVIFAVDSIPAVFAVTQDPMIVYFSNILAIMGLRSLFFLLSGVKDKFWLLSYGLGVLLLFIGSKMLLHEFLHLSISTNVSLFVILGILVGSIALSIIFPSKRHTSA